MFFSIFCKFWPKTAIKSDGESVCTSENPAFWEKTGLNGEFAKMMKKVTGEIRAAFALIVSENLAVLRTLPKNVTNLASKCGNIVKNAQQKNKFKSERSRKC